MSATNRGSKRKALDSYYTTDDVARRCVASLGDLTGRWCVEPSSGGGAFARAMAAAGAELVTTVDIDIAADADVCHDWLGVALPLLEIAADLAGHTPCHAPDMIIGNPPYSEAEAHIRHAIEVVRPMGTVAFLLRLAFLESSTRQPFWRDHPPASVQVLVPRPSFTGDGRSDSCAYAWYRWTDTHCGAPRLGWLP